MRVLCMYPLPPPPPHRSLESWAPIIFSFSHFLFLSVYLTPKRAMNKTNLSNWAYQLENFPNGTFYFGNTRSADLFNDRNKIDGLDLWRFDPENMRNNRRQKPKPTEKEQWNTHRKCYTSHHSRVCYNIIISIREIAHRRKLLSKISIRILFNRCFYCTC